MPGRIVLIYTKFVKYNIYVLIAEKRKVPRVSQPDHVPYHPRGSTQVLIGDWGLSYDMYDVISWHVSHASKMGDIFTDI